MPLILTFFSLFFVLMSSTNVQAQVMIEQGKVVIQANPGETIVNTLTVHNTSKNTISVRAYWEDFMYVEPFKGEKLFTAAGTMETSSSQWTNFSPQQFTLEPNGTRLISYSIQVPASAKGGYYGVMFFEEGAAKTVDTVGVSIVTRVGSLFFIETTNATRKGEIKNLVYEDRKFKADFYNLGDVVLIPDATYFLMDGEGMVVERGAIEKFYLAAGKNVSFSTNAGGELAPGQYTAILTFEFGFGENYTYEFDFSISPSGEFKLISVAS